MIRGPIVDFYPYPFVDVDDHGYPLVLLNSALIGVLVIALAAGALRLDARVARRERQSQTPADSIDPDPWWA